MVLQMVAGFGFRGRGIVFLILTVLLKALVETFTILMLCR